MSTNASATPGQIDARGARFAAVITTVVLAVVLIFAPSTFSTILLAAQAIVFVVAAAFGIQRSPYSAAFRTLVRPRLAPPTAFEDAAPPRFAQSVGLVFALVGLIGFVAGADLLGLIAVGVALAAALLNAAFGFCLGCELYLLGKRLTSRSSLAT